VILWRVEVALLSVSADKVMANILHRAINMEEDAGAQSMPALYTYPPPIFASVAAGGGSHSGHGHNPRGPRGGRGFPNMCNACGSLDHIMSSCTARDALLKWTLAKRKMIVHKYGTPGGSAYAHATLLTDVLADETDSLPTLRTALMNTMTPK
jgi:hypothetical protein